MRAEMLDSGVSQSLFNFKAVDCGKAQTTVVIKDAMGRDHKTTLYNLEIMMK